MTMGRALRYRTMQRKEGYLVYRGCEIYLDYEYIGIVYNDALIHYALPANLSYEEGKKLVDYMITNGDI